MKILILVEMIGLYRRNIYLMKAVKKYITTLKRGDSLC